MSVITKGLDYHQFHLHLWECGIAIQDASMGKPGLEKVIIRTDTGDHELASIWRKGDTLYFDLGQAIKEE